MNRKALDWIENDPDSPYRLELTKQMTTTRAPIAVGALDARNTIRPMFQLVAEPTTPGRYIQRVCPECKSPDLTCSACSERDSYSSLASYLGLDIT